MTYELLVNNVCDANESHIENPFAKDEIVGYYFEGGIFNPKTGGFDMKPIYHWGILPEFIKKRLQETD
jgi:hypothetical protein